MNAELIALRQECDEARAQLGLEARLRKERDEARAHISFVTQTTEARLRTERDEARTQLDERTKAFCAVQIWSRGKFDEMDYMLRMAQHEKGLMYQEVEVLRKENRQLRYAVAQIVQKAQMRFSQLQAELIAAKTGGSRSTGQENAQGEPEIIYPPPPPASSPVLPLPQSTSLQKTDFTMLPKTEPFTDLDLQYPPEICQTPNISPPPGTGSKPLPPFGWDPDRKRR
ncbi:hypothetical protein FB45DRAFT_169123 [Roridomyces roridus]|uniref:Uncharacterized protein n=1 Tax=Roridomyces roridus TaxID=1738132 RepID=A0AAD7BEH8_9AGAR|nr:hypothetical protein FB45DRAFT_169123 [Roridomyces roridus]